MKIFFISLFLAGSVILGYFSIQTAIALIQYFTYQGKAPARITRWETREIRGKFPLKAHYSFEIEGVTWQGMTQFNEAWHLNEASAIAAIREKAKESWEVWFQPNNPAKSSLERNFPVNLVCRTAICCAVFGYFIFLILRRKLQFPLRGVSNQPIENFVIRPDHVDL